MYNINSSIMMYNINSSIMMYNINSSIMMYNINSSIMHVVNIMQIRTSTMTSLINCWRDKPKHMQWLVTKTMQKSEY